jgi:hypothetical protein
MDLQLQRILMTKLVSAAKNKKFAAQIIKTIGDDMSEHVRGIFIQLGGTCAYVDTQEIVKHWIEHNLCGDGEMDEIPPMLIPPTTTTNMLEVGFDQAERHMQEHPVAADSETVAKSNTTPASNSAAETVTWDCENDTWDADKAERHMQEHPFTTAADSETATTDSETVAKSNTTPASNYDDDLSSQRPQQKKRKAVRPSPAAETDSYDAYSENDSENDSFNNVFGVGAIVKRTKKLKKFKHQARKVKKLKLSIAPKPKVTDTTAPNVTDTMEITGSPVYATACEM